MRIYLDMCSIQRSLDDMSQLRVRLEVEAVLGIIAFCESGRAELVSSDALGFENGRDPYPVRKAHAVGILAEAGQIVRLTPDVQEQARTRIQAGINPLVVLHLSCAFEAKADDFCTCDDRLRKRARATQTEPPRVLDPLELVAELGR